MHDDPLARAQPSRDLDRPAALVADGHHAPSGAIGSRTMSVPSAMFSRAVSEGIRL